MKKKARNTILWFSYHYIYDSLDIIIKLCSLHTSSYNFYSLTHSCEFITCLYIYSVTFRPFLKRKKTLLSCLWKMCKWRKPVKCLEAFDWSQSFFLWFILLFERLMRHNVVVIRSRNVKDFNIVDPFEYLAI